MKPPRACRQCRESKRRCIRKRIQGSCEACQRKRQQCSSNTGISSGLDAARLSSPQSSPASESPGGLAPEQALEFVRHYLDKVHDRPHSIFHPTHLLSRTRDGSVPEHLLLAICAIGCKFSDLPERRDLESRLTASAKELLLADLENICIENIQACILVAILCAGHCKPSSEALFIRTGVSMAVIMNLGCVAKNDASFEGEIARRTWWSLYVADHWVFAGLGLPNGMTYDCVPCGMPMDERAFRSLGPGQSIARASSDPPGIWACMLSLVRIAKLVRDLNSRVTAGTRCPELSDAVRDVERQLQAWAKALPSHLQMNIDNLGAHQRNGLGGLFAVLHLNYHHFSTLLYFRFLEGAPACPWAAECKRHASAFSNLLHLSRQLEGCGASYPVIGHMTMVSSSVLVHMLLFGDLSEIDKARQELNANFKALTEMISFWPSISGMMNRLVHFQNLCLIASDSHRLDGWMAKFLHEYLIPPGVRDGLPLELGLFAGNFQDEDVMLRAEAFKESGRYTDIQSL